MMQVQRSVVGGETWPVKPEIRDAIGDWEIFDANLLENPEGAVRCYVDIHECDGDPPSLWRVLDLAEAGEARVAFELDARLLSAEERAACPEEIREAGREIAGEMIKDRVYDVLGRLDE